MAAQKAGTFWPQGPKITHSVSLEEGQVRVGQPGQPHHLSLQPGLDAPSAACQGTSPGRGQHQINPQMRFVRVVVIDDEAQGLVQSLPVVIVQIDFTSPSQAMR